jgi:hypothetical protein
LLYVEEESNHNAISRKVFVNLAGSFQKTIVHHTISCVSKGPGFSILIVLIPVVIGLELPLHDIE